MVMELTKRKVRSSSGTRLWNLYHISSFGNTLRRKLFTRQIFAKLNPPEKNLQNIFRFSRKLTIIMSKIFYRISNNVSRYNRKKNVNLFWLYLLLLISSKAFNRELSPNNACYLKYRKIYVRVPWLILLAEEQTTKKSKYKTMINLRYILAKNLSVANSQNVEKTTRENFSPLR